MFGRAGGERPAGPAPPSRRLGPANATKMAAGHAAFDHALFGVPLFGLALFGLAVFGLAVFGLAVFGLAVFGLALFGLAVFGLAVFDHALFGHAAALDHLAKQVDRLEALRRARGPAACPPETIPMTMHSASSSSFYHPAGVAPSDPRPAR